jgi:hypothetical protein
VGREKPERRRKKRKKSRPRRLDAGLKHHLGAIDLGGANDLGAEVAAISPSRLL